MSDLRLQQNLHESTIGQQHTYQEIIQLTLARSALCWQKLSMIEFLRGCAMCTVRRRNAHCAPILYSIRERVLWWRLAKKIMNIVLSTAINGKSQRAESCLKWTWTVLCVCVCVLCAVHAAIDQWATVWGLPCGFVHHGYYKHVEDCACYFSTRALPVSMNSQHSIGLFLATIMEKITVLERKLFWLFLQK